MGPNTTGTPNTEDYTLGRGIVYLSELDANLRPTGGWRDVGNSPDFTTTTNADTLDHYSSRHGLKILDRQATINQTIGLTFSFDEVNHENLALFFSGVKKTTVNAGVAGFTVYTMIPADSVALGRSYDIQNAAGIRAYGIDPADLTVVTTAGSPVSLVLGTDFTVDSARGSIFLKDTSTVVAGAISGTLGIKVTLAANSDLASVNQVAALTRTSQILALKFVQEDAENPNEKEQYDFRKVNLTANGDMAMISDDWQKGQFTGKAEQNAAYVDADGNGGVLDITELPAPIAA